MRVPFALYKCDGALGGPSVRCVACVQRTGGGRVSSFCKMEADLVYNALQLPPFFDRNLSDIQQLPQDDTNQNNVFPDRVDGFLHNTFSFSPWNHLHDMTQGYVECPAENSVPETQNQFSYNNYGLDLGVSASTYYPEEAQKKQKLKQDCDRDSPAQLRGMGVVPCVSTKRYQNTSRQRTTDQLRRMRIAQGLDLLQELLPDPKKGSKASQWDDIINYIKYLQLQIKDLSQNKLAGESTSNPFIYLEGHGHYLVHDQMLIESLEEKMGRLLEANPSEAAKLLESKGLFMMPSALVEDLSQAM